jgi:glyoxylase-like metal-dependent hydrolase (beta-lactamase superfamily II)
MSHDTFDIGGVHLTRIVEAEGPLLRPAEIFPDSTPQHLANNLAWLAPQFYDPVADKLVISIQAFLLRSGGKNILVDTCVGDCKARVRADFDQQRWGWLGRLKAAGIQPEDIDIVLSTHLHVDHVGWHTQLVDGEWQPTFPNARYLFARPEWEYWKHNEGHPGLARTGDYVGDSVWPIFEAGLADLVDSDHAVTDAISLQPSPGHTPGHVCVSIRSEGSHAILSGDVFHHPLQCCYPQWSTRFCADPEQARVTRQAFLARCAAEGTLVLPAHFPTPTAGTVHIAEPGSGHAYRFEFVPLA